MLRETKKIKQSTWDIEPRTQSIKIKIAELKCWTILGVLIWVIVILLNGTFLSVIKKLIDWVSMLVLN